MKGLILTAAAVLALAAAPGMAASTAYQIDKAHSEASFKIRHLTGNVRGRFNDFAGTVSADPAKPQGGSVEFTIKAASIDTGVPDRDNHLKSADFFDVAKFPEITFKSSRITAEGQQPVRRRRHAHDPRRRQGSGPAGHPARHRQGSARQRHRELRARDQAEPQGLRRLLEPRARCRLHPRRRSHDRDQPRDEREERASSREVRRRKLSGHAPVTATSRRRRCPCPVPRRARLGRRGAACGPYGSVPTEERAHRAGARGPFGAGRQRQHLLLGGLGPREAGTHRLRAPFRAHPFRGLEERARGCVRRVARTGGRAQQRHHRQRPHHVLRGCAEQRRGAADVPRVRPHGLPARRDVARQGGRPARCREERAPPVLRESPLRDGRAEPHRDDLSEGPPRTRGRP